MSGSINYLLNVLAYGVSRVLSMGAAFFCFVLFARMLGSHALGQLAFVMAFVTIAGNLADFGTNTALAKSLAEHRERDADMWFGNYLMVRAVLAVATLVLSVVVSFIVGEDRLGALLIGCVATPFMAARFFESLFQIFERPRFSVYAALVLGISQITLCSGALLLGCGVTGYMVAFAASHFAYFVFALGLSRRLVIPRLCWRPALSAALFKVATPIGVSALVMAAYSRADVFMLTYWQSSTDVGFYNAAYRLLDLSVAVAATAALPLVPILTQRLQHNLHNTRALCTDLLALVATVLLPVAILTALFAEPILRLVYGEEFTRSAPVLSIFAWLFMATGYWMIASSINLAAGNLRYNYWLTPLAAVVSIGFNAFFIPRHGIIGAAIGTALSTALTSVVVMWNVQRSIGNVHDPRAWAKLLLCGTSLYGVVRWARYVAPDLHPCVIAGGGLVLYTGLVCLFGLVPVDRLREVVAAPSRDA